MYGKIFGIIAALLVTGFIGTHLDAPQAEAWGRWGRGSGPVRAWRQAAVQRRAARWGHASGSYSGSAGSSGYGSYNAGSSAGSVGSYTGSAGSTGAYGGSAGGNGQVTYNYGACQNCGRVHR